MRSVGESRGEGPAFDGHHGVLEAAGRRVYIYIYIERERER